MKILLLLSTLFLSIHIHAQVKNEIKETIKSTAKIESSQSNNFFENGISPTTFRYFYPEVNESGYSMIVYQTEGMDNISYFGNRLTDKNSDGRLDIIQRIKEFVTGDWDFPSTEPRAFIKNEIDKDFNSKLFRDTSLIFTSVDHKYHEDESGAYFYNFSWFDPTVIEQIGMDNWKGYLSKNGFIENIDYATDGTYLEFMPRIYLKKNGQIKDITSTNLKFSNEILATRARFPWDQALSLGDFDGDGDDDILMTGGHQSTSNLSGLPAYNPRTSFAFYYFNNGANGKLLGEIYELDIDLEEGYMWYIPEGTNQYATQMNGDPALEIISELYIRRSDSPSSVPIRQFGYFKLIHETKQIEFIPLFIAKDYLLDTAWNIFPKLYLPMSFLNPQKELILYLFTSPSGSPAKEFTGLNTDFTTGSDFTKGVVQQYFRMYEKIKTGNEFKLIDVTKDYFYDKEYETFSLDNSGTIHLIDVDNDGKLDLYPQLGAMPNPIMGGINQFSKYPAWNGKTNTLYYFKQMGNGKFKLTDLTEINGFYYPNNLESDYSVFNSEGIYTNNETDFGIGPFTLQNNASLNDIDGDGKLEIISSSNPDYLHVFTKTLVKKNSDFDDLSLSPYLKIETNYNPNLDQRYRYDFSEIRLSSDTLFSVIDETLIQMFIIIDPLNKMTHLPEFYGAHPKKSSFYIHPPKNISKNKLGQTNSSQVPLRIERTPLEGKPSDQTFVGAYYTRIENDLEMRTKDFYYSSKNLSPLPFKELTSKISQNSNLRGFEVEISMSFDLNQNHYFINNQRVNGLKYGYELYLGDSLLKRELFSNVNYQSYDNGAKTKIYGLNILTGNLDLEKIDYKIFALDSFDETIRTYGTMLDRRGPVLITKSNITAKLDDKGGYELKIEQVDNGSTDNVGITQLTLSKTAFTCADLGTSKVTFTAKDASGNTSSTEVTVTVVDEIKPTLKAKAAFTIKLDAEGKGALKWEDLDEGSSDNCSIKDKILSKTAFTCADLGTSKVTFTAKDASGNTSATEVTITVVDEIKPVAKVKTGYVIKLDVEGKATLKWEDIDEGSSDNCSIKERKLSKTEFSRTDGGDNKVTYTVTDVGGNTTSIEATVRVDIVLSSPERARESNTIKAYPNPVDDYLYLEFAEGMAYGSIRTSSLVDASGKVIGELTVEDGGNGRIGFSTRELKNGMYFLRLGTRDTLHLIKFTVIH